MFVLPQNFSHAPCFPWTSLIDLSSSLAPLLLIAVLLVDTWPIPLMPLLLPPSPLLLWPCCPLSPWPWYAARSYKSWGGFHLQPRGWLQTSRDRTKERIFLLVWNDRLYIFFFIPYSTSVASFFIVASILFATLWYLSFTVMTWELRRRDYVDSFRRLSFFLFLLLLLYIF